MASTNWSPTSVNSTNISPNFGVEGTNSKPVGSAIGLLLALTHAIDMSTDYGNWDTKFTKSTINSTNWS